jgi:hypothetical protein
MLSTSIAAFHRHLQLITEQVEIRFQRVFGGVWDKVALMSVKYYAEKLIKFRFLQRIFEQKMFKSHIIQDFASIILEGFGDHWVTILGPIIMRRSECCNALELVALANKLQSIAFPDFVAACKRLISAVKDGQSDISNLAKTVKCEFAKLKPFSPIGICRNAIAIAMNVKK